jgi:hypothetical protein
MLLEDIIEYIEYFNKSAYLEVVLDYSLDI